jgi:hypothetical protein
MGCGCLVVLLGTAFPRLALIITWLFTDRVQVAFDDNWLLPLAGLLLLPFTTFFYVVAYAPTAGVSGFGWLFVIFGFLLDLSAWFGGGREGATRYQRA